MATKKKSKRATKKSRKTSAKKSVSAKHSAKKKTTKKLAAKKTVSKKPVAKKRSSAKRSAPKRPVRRSRPSDTTASDRDKRELRTGALSGDLQGLSDAATADSESVDELVEEGNAFEADAVAGVEHADDEMEREVHTHEVPQDDVPEEYEDQD